MQINDFFPNVFAKIVLPYTTIMAETLDNTDFPEIFNTDIVTDEIDTTWVVNERINALQKKPLIIFSTPYTTGSNEEIQLMKILGACQADAETYQIIQISEEDNFAWHQIKARTQPRVALLFGVHPTQLGISALFMFNYPNKFDNTIWIPTLSLPELSQQPEAKKQLWGNALKPIFVDNK